AYFGDKPNCVERYKLYIGLFLSTPGVSAKAFAECASAMKGVSCEEALAGLPACQFKGTRPTGSACTLNSQCQTGFCQYGFESCGVCAATVALGADCLEVAECEAPGQCINDTCQLVRAAGSSCDPTQTCASGLYCNDAGNCAPTLKAAGTPCDPTNIDEC